MKASYEKQIIVVRPHCHGPRGKFLGDLKKINKSWKNMNGAYGFAVWREEDSSLPTCIPSVHLFLGSTRQVAQPLVCAGAGKRVLISIVP